MKPISLRQLIGATERRLVVLPGELAGYLVLSAVEVGGAVARELVPETVALASDGRVVLLDAKPVEGGWTPPRQLLECLLRVSTAVSPALSRAFLANDGDRLAYVRKLETALVPLNRAASRRALARLHRELLKPSSSLKAESEPESVMSVQASGGSGSPRHLAEVAGAKPNSLSTPRDDTPPPEEVSDAALQGPRTTTLVIAPVLEVKVAVPVHRETAVPSGSDSEPEPRSTTLVIAEVAPIAELPLVVESTLALPLVRRRVRTDQASLSVVDDDKTSVDAPVAFDDDRAAFEPGTVDGLQNDVLEEEPDSVAGAEADAGGVTAEAVEAAATVVVEEDELMADNDFDAVAEMTVMPLGSYDLLYVSESSQGGEPGGGVSQISSHDSLPGEADREGFLMEPTPEPAHVEPLRPELRTFYRTTKGERHATRSDADLLAAEFEDDAYWEGNELCRGLLTVAGLSLTPAVPMVQLAAPVTDTVKARVEPSVALTSNEVGSVASGVS